MFDFYVTRGRTQIQSEFQYRAATYFWMIGMLAEPIVYLVVWTTIAEQQGGSVQGITTGEFAAYYIVWTLDGRMSFPRHAETGQRREVRFLGRWSTDGLCVDLANEIERSSDRERSRYPRLRGEIADHYVDLIRPAAKH